MDRVYIDKNSNADIYLYGNYFTSKDTGYIVGRNGIILKTTDGGGNFIGIEIIGNKIPTQFSLSQSYPNPFNPTTNIIYQIPKNSFVSLKVYDVLGKEVATLVNELLSPGTYEATFDATKYASGVYFYKLETSDFAETKRMMLIK